MKITKKQLYSIIEQVVGYNPTKTQDDIVSSGMVGSEVDPSSAKDQEAKDASIRQLTQTRQKQLDDDETVDAEATGQQLQDITNEGQMKITKAQLRRIIIEATKKKDGNEATVKYNADPALKGDQTKLPDNLQKGIIDKANEGEGKLKEIDGADHDGSLMDLDDYYELEDLLAAQLRDFLRGGYSKPDLIQALTNIVNDAL